MTSFAKDLFDYSSGHLYYTFKGERKFVARFKYRNAPITKAKFLKQLIKNHTPEEYFGKVEKRMAPLEILREADPVWFAIMMNR
jgi:hypothetical protein